MNKDLRLAHFNSATRPSEVYIHLRWVVMYINICMVRSYGLARRRKYSHMAKDRAIVARTARPEVGCVKTGIDNGESGRSGRTEKC